MFKLSINLIGQKWHDDQCTMVVGNISFLKVMKVLRGECEVTKAMKNENKKVRSKLNLAIQQGDATYSPSPKMSMSLVMAFIWIKEWSKTGLINIWSCINTLSLMKVKVLML